MVSIGHMAPNLEISEWVQGEATNLDLLRGRVVVVEVFQINCPGCFLYGWTEILEVSRKYDPNDVVVLGLGTAFEDFHINTIANLRRLAQKREVVGETLRILGQRGWLEGNQLRYRIPFPLAMDRLIHVENVDVESKARAMAEMEVDGYGSLGADEQRMIVENMGRFLAERVWIPATFDEYGLRGTPTTLVVDREGILRHSVFGSDGRLYQRIEELIRSRPR